MPATPGQLRYAAACATRRSEATAQNHCYACDGLGFSAQPLEKLDDKKIADVDQWFRDADQGDEAIPF